jgi:mono/diheme cytochrome c family protein
MGVHQPIKFLLMRKTSLVLIILVAVVFAGCYYHKEVTPPPTTTTTAGCDTLVVRYSVEIKNILSANCYSCHSGNAVYGGGHKYDVYPGDLVTMAQNGKLVKAITHSPGAFPMPQNAPMLSACDIAKIRWWVTNGAPNN